MEFDTRGPAMAATRRARRRGLLILAAALIGGLLSLFWRMQAHAETVDGSRFTIIDGDTVDYRGERIRILNIDAPESFRSRCEAELKLALRTKERLAGLLRVGVVDIQRHGQDRYRRTLAKLVTTNGDVGNILVREGLALPWQDGAEAKEARLQRWCGARYRLP
jgi:micrococcal nuclease